MSRSGLKIVTYISEYVTMNTFNTATAFMFIVSYNTGSEWPVSLFCFVVHSCVHHATLSLQMNIIWATDMELIKPYGFLAPFASDAV